MLSELLTLIPSNDPMMVIVGLWVMFSAVGFALTTGKH